MTVPLLVFLIAAALRPTIAETTRETRNLRQTSSCGHAGYLTHFNGVIDSHPGFATNQIYSNDLNCTWTIQAPAGKAVQLSAKSFDLESHSPCNSDYLEVFDGDGVSGRRLGIFCGSNMSTVTSRQNFLTLYFHTDDSVQQKGFRLQYTFVRQTLSCGHVGYLTQDNGVIDSHPGFATNQNYSNDLDCRWTIQAPAGKAVQLSAKSFDLESASPCDYDYLEVFDGDGVSFGSLGKFCGSSMSTVTSRQNFLTLHFHTDDSVQQKGFRLQYTFVNASALLQISSCGYAGYMTQNNGVIDSHPGFATNQDYPNDMNCTWTIQAPVGKAVQLSAKGFDLESASSVCYDALDVFDGDLSGRSLGKFCGSNMSTVTSRQNFLTLHFHTDASVQRKGFRLLYTFVNASAPSTATTSQPRNMPFTECPGHWTPWHGNTAYRVSWVTTSRNEVIAFTVTARITHSQWLGLGLSRDNKMGASDVYIARRAGDRWVVEDRYASGYSAPAVDVHQDVTHVTSHEDNGVLTVTFRRRLQTGDRDDMNVTGCLYLLFAYGAADNDSIHYHAQNKVVSPNQFCFTNCDEIHVEGTMDIGCTARAWNVTLDMRRLGQIYPGAKADDIYMGESSCTGVVHGGILTFNRGFVGCLTDKRVTGPSIVYLNELVYAVHDTVRPYIIRGYRWTVPVHCDVYNNGSTSGHIPTNNSSSEHLYTTTNSSDYTVQLSFYQDLNYVQIIPGNPLHVGVGTFVYVKVYTPIVDWGVTMRVHTCYTKPMATSANITNYYLIKNGCEVDTNTHISSQTAHETRFQFQNFESTAVGAGMFVLCDATFCGSADTSRHCTETCNPGAK